MGPLFDTISACVSTQVRIALPFNRTIAVEIHYRLDSMFNSSINLLAKQASLPTTEDHQRLYNQFVQSYGTHYVSNVIMGATAYIYSFMSASYHSTANTEETSSQISLMAQYKKFQVQGNSQTADMYAQIKETFKQSTSAVIEYHPPVDLHGEENQTEWK